MDPAALISTIHQFLFVIVVFAAFLLYAFIRGRQSITNLILGLYLALLISLEFPFYGVLLAQVHSAQSEAILKIGLFAVFTLIATLLFSRILPSEYGEGTFEAAGKKLLFAIAATVLVLAYSYHALPVTELVNPGSPVQAVFAPENRFFIWLCIPLLALFVL
jgi:hypothetical protein